MPGSSPGMTFCAWHADPQRGGRINANKDKLGLKTIVLAVDDGEATRNTADGARVNIKKAGLTMVYGKTYPPTTTPTALALLKRTSVAKNDMAARRLAKINRLAGGRWEN
jgi:hypothetical protein